MERSELEWSGSTPLSRRAKTGLCLYCGNLQTNGHDPECKFLDPKASVEEIKTDIDEARRASEREIIRSMGIFR